MASMTQREWNGQPILLSSSLFLVRQRETILDFQISKTESHPLGGGGQSTDWKHNRQSTMPAFLVGREGLWFLNLVSFSMLCLPPPPCVWYCASADNLFDFFLSMLCDSDRALLSRICGSHTISCCMRARNSPRFIIGCFGASTLQSSSTKSFNLKVKRQNRSLREAIPRISSHCGNHRPYVWPYYFFSYWYSIQAADAVRQHHVWDLQSSIIKTMWPR